MHLDPNPRNLYDIYKTDKPEETKDTLIKNFIESFEENDKTSLSYLKVVIIYNSNTYIFTMFI